MPLFSISGNYSHELQSNLRNKTTLNIYTHQNLLCVLGPCTKNEACTLNSWLLAEHECWIEFYYRQ